MRKLVATGIWLLFSVVAAALILEGVVRGLDIFPELRGSLASEQLSGGEAEPGEENPRSVNMQVHPFLGWARRPGVKIHFRGDPIPIFQDGRPTDWAKANSVANAFGHFSGVSDYRSVSNEAFVVGIFGGSVANNLSNLGGEALTRALEERFPERLGEIVILNFGSGGYKQPQPLIALVQAVALGVPFDLIINLDGFNEVLFGGRDSRAGHHPLFPSRHHHSAVIDLTSPTPSHGQIRLMSRVLEERERAQAIADRLAQPGWLGRSELLRLVQAARARSHRQRAVTLEGQLQAMAAAGGDADRIASLSDPCLETQDCWEVIREIWVRSSRMMAAIAGEIGAGYVHALQPSQYLAGTKTLSDDERRLALQPDPRRIARHVEKGYPYLLAGGEELRAAGIDFVSLTRIFEDRSETIYRDTCCHFNLLGNEILARELVARFDGEAVVSSGIAERRAKSDLPNEEKTDYSQAER